MRIRHTHGLLDRFVIVLDQVGINWFQKRPRTCLALHVVEDLAQQDVVSISYRLPDTANGKVSVELEPL